MNMISFTSHSDLAEYMRKKVLDGKTVTAVLFYDDAKFLLKELFCYNETVIESVEIHLPIYNNYDKEYYVTLADDFGVWVEEAYKHEKESGFEGYARFGDEDVIALIDSNANSCVIKAADGAVCIEFKIDHDNFYNDYESCIEIEHDEYNVDLLDVIKYLINQLEHLCEE